LHQGVLQREGDGALARAAQAREPDRRPPLPQQLLPLLARDVPLVPGDVRRFDLGHAEPLLIPGNRWRWGKSSLYSAGGVLPEGPASRCPPADALGSLWVMRWEGGGGGGVGRWSGRSSRSLSCRNRSRSLRLTMPRSRSPSTTSRRHDPVACIRLRASMAS